MKSGFSDVWTTFKLRFGVLGVCRKTFESVVIEEARFIFSLFSFFSVALERPSLKKV